jgi:type VI secretion system secreted protein Hcp
MMKTITSRFVVPAILAACLVVAQSACAAAVDYFLKIDGIDGESSDHAHENEIDVLSWSWGVSNSGSHSGGGGGGAGKVIMQDFISVKFLDKASPKLMLACATEQPVRDVVLVGRKGDEEKGVEFLRIRLQDVLISSYSVGGSGRSEELPMESMSLNFAAIEFEYVPVSEDGRPGEPVRVAWRIDDGAAQ